MNKTTNTQMAESNISLLHVQPDIIDGAKVWTDIAAP